MENLQPVYCFRRKDHFRAFKLTRENASELLKLMGFSPDRNNARNQYGDKAYSVITDAGIEYGSRFGDVKANYGDYILDYDGHRLWQVYTPEQFAMEFWVWSLG